MEPMTASGAERSDELDDEQLLVRWREVVGPTLDARRVRLGLSHDDVVEAAGSSRSTWLRMRHGPSRQLDDGREVLQLPQLDTCHAYEAALRLPLDGIRALLGDRVTPTDLLEVPIDRRREWQDEHRPASQLPKRSQLYVRLIRAVEQLEAPELEAVLSLATLLADTRSDDDDELVPS